MRKANKSDIKDNLILSINNMNEHKFEPKLQRKISYPTLN